MKIKNWLKTTFGKDQRMVRKALKASSKSRYVIFMDLDSELIVHAFNKKCVPVRTYDKDNNLIPLVKRLISNGHRNKAVLPFIRQIDGALYNLTMNDKKALKKIQELNKEAKKQGIAFGFNKPKSLKDQMLEKVEVANKE